MNLRISCFVIFACDGGCNLTSPITSNIKTLKNLVQSLSIVVNRLKIFDTTREPSCYLYWDKNTSNDMCTFRNLISLVRLIDYPIFGCTSTSRTYLSIGRLATGTFIFLHIFAPTGKMDKRIGPKTWWGAHEKVGVSHNWVRIGGQQNNW